MSTRPRDVAGPCDRCGVPCTSRICRRCWALRPRTAPEPEPTEAELDALIAARRPTMPPRDNERGEDTYLQPRRPRIFVIRTDRRWNRLLIV